MPTQAELEFVEESGRYFARTYRTPPAVGRVAGWLMVCADEAPTAADIARDLAMSRSGVGAAIANLEQWRFVRRVRRTGERADRVMITAAFDQQLEDPAEYQALDDLMTRGLQVLSGDSLQRRGRLLELQAFNAFIAERMPQVAVEWRHRRDELRSAGRLPAPASPPPRSSATVPSSG